MRKLRFVGLLCFALVCIVIPAASSKAATSHRVFMPMISTPIPSDFVYSVGWDLPNYDLYTGSIDGKVHRLTNTVNINEVYPTWSPDRNRIAYAMFDIPTARGYIAILWLSNPTMPTHVLEVSGGARELEWSPTGTHFVFVSQENFQYAIYSVNVDGSNLQRLTEFYGCVESPTWSPDGTKIAFAARPMCRAYDGYYQFQGYIYVMNADGSNLTQLTTSTEHGWAGRPTWSPDGQWIAFRSDNHISIMRPDGSQVKAITKGDWYHGDELPSWSPDSRYIVFNRVPYKVMDANYIVEVATGNETFLTNLRDEGLVWAR